ncbi:hypothetical protein Kpho02_37460 [Kitasatospora phosalacinea]|uniref:Uncharacterized protein n=1 Tax=Kitasatospora phosalacinea TaxID=2065 RepID=A0A9W6V3N5_9ACTN|nr:hypothetical protein [Kitasatospora phosalacinea]GLW71447.1 hypothetical protein Kpho02_37460 [Kitasatospora phosalacinea]
MTQPLPGAGPFADDPNRKAPSSAPVPLPHAPATGYPPTGSGHRAKSALVLLPELYAFCREQVEEEFGPGPGTVKDHLLHVLGTAVHRARTGIDPHVLGQSVATVLSVATRYRAHHRYRELGVDDLVEVNPRRRPAP